MTQDAVRYVCPQRDAFPAPVPAALPINIRVSRAAGLRVLNGVHEVWDAVCRLLPERRVILPFPPRVAEHAERLAIDIDETVRG